MADNSGSPAALVRLARPAASDLPAVVGALEKLMLALAQIDARVVGLAGPTAGGHLAALSSALSKSIAASSKTVLLIEFEAVDGPRSAHVWDPSKPLDRQLIVRDDAGFDRLVGATSPVCRPLFNNPQLVRRVLTDELGEYQSVIMTLPPLINPPETLPNPLSLARAVDAVVLVCASAVTTADEATESVSVLKRAGANLVGAILDDSDNTAVSAEIARAVERIWVLPRTVRSRVANFIRNSGQFGS